MKVKEILEKLCDLAPLNLAEGYDNAGFLVGDKNKEVTKILVCLDLDEKVVEEAKINGCELIVSHHPIMFGGIKHITAETSAERAITNLIASGISLISMHTNLDSADGGLNDYFAKKLNLVNVKPFLPSPDGGAIGRIGELETSMKYEDFIICLKECIGTDCVRYCGETEEVVSKIGLCTGSGGEFMDTAFSMGADVYVSADIKYNIFRNAYENDKKLIDAGHYDTEICAMELLEEYLKANTTAQVLKSEANVRPYSFG